MENIIKRPVYVHISFCRCFGHTDNYISCVVIMFNGMLQNLCAVLVRLLEVRERERERERGAELCVTFT
jgi:hypothetical protein